MYEKFENTLLEVLKSPSKKRLLLWLTLGGFIASVAMIPTELVMAKMLPGKNNDTYSVYIDLPTASSIEQTQKVTECIVNILQKEPEALDMEVFLGSGSPLDFAGLIKGSQFKNSENVAEIVLNLTKKHNRSEPSYMMVQRLRPIIQKECSSLTPETNIKFVEPPAGPPTMAAIVAEVYGNNPTGIRHLSERVKEVFTKTDGLVDIDIMQDEIVDTIEMRVNSDKIARSGLNIKHVNDTLYLAYE